MVTVMLDDTIDLNTNKEEKVLEKKDVLTLEQAVEYLGIEDYWIEEMILTGELLSLSVEHLDQYLEDMPTEELQKT